MTNTRVTQGHKVLVAAGGAAPPRVGQGHKVLVFSGGQPPAFVSQAAKVIIFRANLTEPQVPRRTNFQSFVP